MQTDESEDELARKCADLQEKVELLTQEIQLKDAEIARLTQENRRLGDQVAFKDEIASDLTDQLHSALFQNSGCELVSPST